MARRLQPQAAVPGALQQPSLSLPASISDGGAMLGGPPGGLGGLPGGLPQHFQQQVGQPTPDLSGRFGQMAPQPGGGSPLGHHAPYPAAYGQPAAPYGSMPRGAGPNGQPRPN